MWFILKSGLFFGLVLMVLPLDPEELPDDHEHVSAIQSLHAAKLAIDDASGFCTREPQVCATGRAALKTVAIRAREGARIAYDMLDDNETSASLSGNHQAKTTFSAMPVPTARPET